MVTRIKPQTKQELANDYGCSPRTIKRMCHEAGIITRKRLNTLEVKKFYDIYGAPEIEYHI